MERPEKKYKEEQQEEEDQSEEEEQTTYFEPHISEKVILESRKNSENKYYLGTVSINERTKWFGWLDSDELPGKLVAEREHLNRAFHESVVYFQLLDDIESSSELSESEEHEIDKLAPKKDERGDKIKCKVVCIKSNPFQNKVIVGRLTVNKKHNKDQFKFSPYNARYPHFEVVKNPFEGKQYRPLLDKKYFSAKVKSWDEK